MKPIWHFTKSVYLPSIMASGTIFLEGYNTERLIRTTDVNRIDASVNASWKNLKMQYKLTGRYVWFTEEDTLFCSTAIKKFPQTALLFDADEIEAKCWYDVIPTIVKNNKKAKKFVEALIKAAKDAGDNPSKWWISSTDVDIKFCKNL